VQLLPETKLGLVGEIEVNLDSVDEDRLDEDDIAHYSHACFLGIFWSLFEVKHIG